MSLGKDEEFNAERLQRIIDVIGGMAGLDFTNRAIIDDSNDSLDVIGNGLNWLSEELEENVIAKSKLEEKNFELNQFAHIVSHDLKAPLNGIHRLVSIIKEDLLEGNVENSFAIIDLVSSRIRHMEGLISGILEYSKIGFTNMEKETINLNQLIDDVYENLHPPKNFSLVVDRKLPVFYGVRIHMIQLFSNLFSNAMKYNDKEHGFVSVGYRDIENGLEFYVKDNGRGIPEKYHHKIFEMFQTLSSDKTYESTGVGLSIVKKIIDSMGGSIRLESDPGKGTNFFIGLPAVSD
ncbi:MAG: HAMP domain-containing histidine kinase [Cyclobacteriaceae bacterium]|nr:HAMP domain-containing histidine kinase [Cyclobacteriaceae bacterium]